MVEKINKMAKCILGSISRKCVSGAYEPLSVSASVHFLTEHSSSETLDTEEFIDSTKNWMCRMIWSCCSHKPCLLHDTVHLTVLRGQN